MDERSSRARLQATAWPEIIALTLILALAAYLRLAHLDYAQMRADDANLWDIVVSFVEEPRVLSQGIPSSLGLPNGPFQAYLLLLAVPFTREPIGAYVVVASLNVAAVLACWAFARAYFGRQVALVAALLFALNPWAVVFSRRLWGNDMTALFTVLLVWSLCDLIVKGRRRDSFMPFVWLAILVQTYLVALVNLATLAMALAFGARRLRPPWLALGLVVFGLLVGPYAANAAIPRLDSVQRVTDQPDVEATTDAESLRFAFHIVGNEGYQAFANQAGRIYDASMGLPFVLSLFLEGLFLVGLALGLFRVVQGLRRRNYALAAPYLLMAVPIFLPASLLVRHVAPVYPYYLLVGYPMHFIFSAVGAQWLTGLGSKLPKSSPLLMKRLLAAAVVAALSLTVGMQLMLAQVFFSVIREYWPKSDYGLPLAYTRRMADSAEQLAAAEGMDRIYVAGANEYDWVVYRVLRRRLSNVFHFNSADTFVAPADGRALYIISNVSTRTMERLAGAKARSLLTLPVPGNGLTISLLELDSERAKALVSGSGALGSPLSFGDAARLDGVEPEGPQDGVPTFRLRWTALEDGSPARLYSYYFRLIDNTHKVYDSLDAPFYFSGQWRPGDQVLNWVELPRPEDLPSGQYWYLSGLYLAAEGNTYRNLTVTDASGSVLQDGVRLGPLVVRPKGGRKPAFALGSGLDGKVVLSGYDIEPGQPQPGGVVKITLYWDAKATLDRDYTVFTHLVNDQGQLVAQHDSQPNNGRYPTSVWRPSDQIVDPHELNIPKTLAPGKYVISVGLYYLPTGERLGGPTSFPLEVR